MSGPLLVWDQKAEPPGNTGDILYWRSYAGGEASVPRYLENHAERLRARYLEFVHDLGESRVAERTLIELLSLSDGFSFWWMTLLAEKSTYKSPRIYTALRLLALEEILRERAPAELTLASSDEILIESVSRLCLSLKIPFSVSAAERDAEERSLRTRLRSLPFPLRGLIAFARHLFARWPLTRLRKPRWSSGGDSLFVCSFFAHLDPVACERGQFHSHQWEALPKQLHASGRRINWLHHFIPGPDVADTATGLRWLERFNAVCRDQGNHAFVDTYLGVAVAARAIAHWIRLNRVFWRLRNIGATLERASWLWPALRDDWANSLTGPVSVSNCLWLELFDAALKDIPPQGMGLYLCENQGWERAMLRAWRKHGHGRIIGAAHATVPFWHLYYFDDPRTLRATGRGSMPQPDILAVNGPAALKLLTQADFPAERLVQVEALRYIGIKTAPSARPANVGEIRVLILGDILPASMQTLLTALGRSRADLPSGWRFTLKPHPLYPVKISAFPGLEDAAETVEPLDRILQHFDVALAANGTSAAVDAYQAGLPVVVGLDGAELNLSPLRGLADVRFAGTSEQMTRALGEAGRDAARRRGTVEFFHLDPELPRWRRLLSS